VRRAVVGLDPANFGDTLPKRLENLIDHTRVLELDTVEYSQSGAT